MKLKLAPQFLVLLLSFPTIAFAECTWQGPWLVCPMPNEYREKIQFTTTYKYSKSEVLPGKPLTLREWIVGEFSSQGQYIGYSEYSWSRYYEADCQSKTITMLDDQYSGNWGRNWEETDAERSRNIGKISYIQPGSFFEGLCQRAISNYSAYLQEKRAEQERLVQEAEAEKKAQAQQQGKPIPKKATAKK